MVFEVIVVARCALTDLGQFIPGNGREIVVFVMVADVEGYDIEDAVVAEGFLLFVVGQVVFLYPPGAERMKTDGEEEAQQQVTDGLRAEEIPDSGNEDGFCREVEGYPFIEGLDFAEPLDAEDLEQGIKQEPDELADEIVVDQFCLPPVGQVGIKFMHSLEGMVFDMIALERHGAGEQLGEVGEDAGQAVGSAAFEQQMMGAFMDHDEKGVVGKSAEQVSCADDDPPGTSFYEPGHGDLEQDEAQDGEERPIIFSDEFSHLGVLLQDLFGTETMGLLFVGIHEICSL